MSGSKCILGVVLTGPQSDAAQICVWNSEGLVDSLKLSRNGTYSRVLYIDELGFNIERKQRVIKITPLDGVVLSCINVNKCWHGSGGYSQGVDESRRKSVTITYPEGEGGQPTIEFEEFPPCEMVPKHWISIVQTPNGHVILFEGGIANFWGNSGLLQFQSIQEIQDLKQMGPWTIHLGSSNLPITMEITRISESATGERNGNCDIVFRPVDGNTIRCFNGNPHLMGNHLQECRGFQVYLEITAFATIVNDVTCLPLEQDK